MKQYVIDELRPADAEQLKNYLREIYGPPVLDNIFWFPLAPELYTDCQKAHTDCHPLYFAMELQSEALCCELLVRTNNRIRCDCIGYATKAQREWIIEQVDSVFESLGIIV